MYKRLYYIGFAAYLCMLVLAIVFYKERIILVDTAFTLLHIIKDGFFCIQIFRFGDAFSQILPLLAFKSHLSLDLMMMAYSVGFILFYLLCYLACGVLLKQYRYALVILLINLLFVTDTFYWIPSEVPQGLCLLMVVFALVAERNMSQISVSRWIALTICLITIAFYHPLMLLALSYIGVFFLLDKRRTQVNKKVLITIGVIYAASLVVKATIFRTQYEQHSLSGLRNFVRLYPDYFTTWSNEQLLKHCFTQYYWIPAILISIVVVYVRGRQWRQLAFFAFAFFGYLFLVNTTYPTPETPQFYIENLYLLLCLVLGLPFIFMVTPVLNEKVFLVVGLLIITSGCARLYVGHGTYTQRLDYERQLLTQYSDQKYVINADRVDARQLQITWGTPYEFWLLSTLERGRTASIVIDKDPERYQWASTTTKSFVVNWDTFPYSALPAPYFNFSDTVTGYHIIK